MAIWSLVETFKDRDLAQQVREQTSTVDFENIGNSNEIEKLVANPLLQSIYSELLRLRVEVQTLFFSEEEDIQINGWKIPKGNLIITPAGSAETQNSGTQKVVDIRWIHSGPVAS